MVRTMKFAILFIRLFYGCLMEIAPFAFLCFYPFDGYYRLTKKKTFLMTVLLLTSVGSIFAVGSIALYVCLPDYEFVFQLTNVIFFLCLILCFVWYAYAVRASWQKKLFVFSFSLTCAVVCFTICNFFLDYYYLDSTFPDGLPFYGITIPTATLITAVIFPLYLLLVKYFFLPVRDGLTDKESGYLSFLSLLLFLVLFSGLSSIKRHYLYENPMTLFLFAALLISTFVIYIVIFRMLYLSHERILLQQENIHTQHQIELRDEQYHRITETISATRRLRHDIKHHILTVQGFLTEGNTAKAETYLNEYLDTVTKYEIMSLCGNSIVNMIVSHYYTLAKENLIDFTIYINIPKELPIQNSDISVLLGNLLENAVTAAASAPEGQRWIRLNMIVSGKTLVVTVDNGFDGAAEYKNGEYLSTKPEHTGLGLKSIVNIANKYNGDTEFTHEDTVFHSSVMLELAESVR